MRYTWLFFIPPVVTAIIIFIAWYRYRIHSHDRDLRRVAVIAHTRTIKYLPAYRKAARHYRILLACAAISFLASLLSLTTVTARPTSRQEHKTATENRDVVLCLDVSGSMRFYQEELLSYFKKIVSELRGERIGVTIFDGKPANLIPPTDDYDALIETVDSLSTNYAKIDGNSSLSPVSASTVGLTTSAIGDGVMGCVNSLDLSDKNLRAKSVIIATDNNYGKNSQSLDIGQVARYASQYGVTFYGIYIPAYDALQREEFMNAMQITNGSARDLGDYYDIDYTNGIAVKRKDASTTIEGIIREIMSQETAKMDGAPEIVYTDQPNIALLVSGICFILFMISIWRLRLWL